MAVLDDRGRLFGRINLIDAAVGLFVFALVPLAYGAWALFRAPTPVVERITPAEILPDQPNQEILVQGSNLRPFLRVAIGSIRVPYLFDTPDQGYVKLPPLKPGSYDLAFFDSREVARFPNAIHVQPPKLVEVRVLVRFVTRPEVVDMMKRAAHEAPAGGTPSAPPPATLLSYEVTEEAPTTETWTTTPTATGVPPNQWVLNRAETHKGRLSIVRGVVRVMARWTADGWQLDDRSIKAGAPFTLNTPSYVLHGEILSLEVAGAK